MWLVICESSEEGILQRHHQEGSEFELFAGNLDMFGGNSGSRLLCRYI